MKKTLLILVAIFMMVLIPGKVEAAEFGLVRNPDNTFKCEKPVTVGNKKKTTCAIKFFNDTSKEISSIITLTLKPYLTSTEGDFTITTDTKVAQLDTRTDKNKMVYVIDMEPVKAGGQVTLGTVTFIAENSASSDDCGGDIIPSFDQSEGGDLSGGEVPENAETGYAIPYIALALGAVGVITVLATSKKKTKMYKI